MFKIPVLDLDKQQVEVGEVYDFTFNVKSNFLGLPQMIVTYLVDRQEKFEVENSSMNEQGMLVLRAKVVQNPLPFLVVFSAIVAGSSILLWQFGITLNKVEKVITVPAGSALTYAAVAITLLTGYKILFK